MNGIIPSRVDWRQFVRLSAVAVCIISTTAVVAQSLPEAIYTDPPVDVAHPAHSMVLHIPSHGVLINGLMYSPSGAGPHPTLVICHGLPGNEKNLDLAQAVRRAGWNAVTFNYRGSWGSPGNFVSVVFWPSVRSDRVDRSSCCGTAQALNRREVFDARGD